MNNIQKLRAQIVVLQDATMDENRNFKSSYDEGRFDALTVVDHLLDSLQEDAPRDSTPSGKWLSEACSWLNQHALFYQNDTTARYDDQKLIRDFRKYMRSAKNLITESRNPESTTSQEPRNDEIPESRNPEIPESPNYRNPAKYGLWTMDSELWTTKWTIYLSGPISGYNIQERRQFFDHIQQALEADGWKVMNPMRNGLPADATTQQHMRRDYQMLSQCDTIMMLPRWNHSAGCINEFNMAVSMGCQVCFCTKEGQPDKNTKPLLFD